MKTLMHPASSGASRTTALLALLLAALLWTAAPLSAAPRIQQDTSGESQETGEEQDLAEIVADPDSFMGETVSVTGYVSNQSLGDHLFVLSADTRLRLDQLLVVMPFTPDQALRVDQQVTVTGTIDTYMPSAPEFADLEFDEEIADSLLGRAVLLADSVTADEATDDEATDDEGADAQESGAVGASDSLTETDAITDTVAVTSPVTTTGTMTDTVTNTVTNTVTGTVTGTTDAGSNVVARIGEREITQSEFEEWFRSTITILAAQQGIPFNEQTAQLFAQLQEQFLQQMVREEVLLDEAERRGITVDDEDVQRIVDDIRAQFDTDEAYEAAIAQLGFADEETLRAYILDNEILQRVSQAIIDEVEITDEDIQQFYDENQELFTQDGVTTPLEDVEEPVRNELERQAFDSAVTQIEEEAGVELMVENLTFFDDGTATSRLPDEPTDRPAGEPVDETDGITGTTPISPTTEITEEITATISLTETGGLTETESMTSPAPVTGTDSTTDTATSIRTATATLVNVSGDEIGAVDFTEVNDSIVEIAVTLDEDHGLGSGMRGIHIHEVGTCTPDFSAAGGHFNPTDAQHGMSNPAGPYAGDLPSLNLIDGAIKQTFLSDRITLGDGPTSLFDEDGSAIIIHAGEDDQMTDPSGDSGDRVACGVIEPGTDSAAN